MIKLEKTEVFGWESAIRGMRNPMNSWDKSDSDKGCVDILGKVSMCKTCDRFEDSDSYPEDCYQYFDNLVIGPNDYALMQKLAKAGPDHRKFMRMINVTVDITAPLYWWKEFDTYKVGTVANSCSTMHKIHEKEFTVEDFSCDHLMDDIYYTHGLTPMGILKQTIDALNFHRNLYLTDVGDGGKDKAFWWQMIQLLPSSYNQKRTIQMNYEVLSNMYNSRKNHKLDEWREFCEMIKGLPHSELITREW